MGPVLGKHDQRAARPHRHDLRSVVQQGQFRPGVGGARLLHLAVGRPQGGVIKHLIVRSTFRNNFNFLIYSYLCFYGGSHR